MLPVLVLADAGAKGDFAPAPSWSMESGAVAGFTMRVIRRRDHVAVDYPGGHQHQQQRSGGDTPETRAE